MRAFEIKRITLDDFDRLQEKGFGNLTDPLRFTELFKDPLLVAKVVYELAIFQGQEPRPSLSEFLRSIVGDDFQTLRSALFEGYRLFFPTRVRLALDAWKMESDQKTNDDRTSTKQDAGENSPSN